MCLCVQVLGLGDRRFGVVRQQRRNFQRNPTVHAACLVINELEQIRGLGEVLQCQLEKQLLSRLALRQFAFDRVIVVFAVLDHVIEDRRVGRQPGDRQLIDVTPEHTRL